MCRRRGIVWHAARVPPTGRIVRGYWGDVHAVLCGMVWDAAALESLRNGGLVWDRIVRPAQAHVGDEPCQQVKELLASL